LPKAREYYFAGKEHRRGLLADEGQNLGCLAVESHDKMCGILTDRDIAMKVTGEQRDPLNHHGRGSDDPRSRAHFR
jgi:hypothetical protein